MSAAKFTSAELKAAISKRYAAPAYQTCFEVGNATGAAGRTFADAVAMGLWPSNGHEIIGFEVKVSRSDWLVEKANPMKAQPVMRFCHRWFLVVPAGLVKADELPETWGLMTYSRKDDLVEGQAQPGTLREARKAPRLTPEPPSPGFMAALVRRAGEGDAAVRNAEIASAHAAARADFDRRVEEAANRRAQQFQSTAKDRAARLEKIEAALGSSVDRFYDDEAFAKAVGFVERSGIFSSYNSVSRALNALRSAEKDLAGALEGAGFKEGA